MTLGTDGRLYVANTGSNTVSVINTATNTVIDTNPNVSGTQAIPVGSSPTSVALSPDGGLAYVANGNDTVSVISTKDYTVVSTVAIDSDTSGGHVVAVTPNGTVYVTDTADDTVRVLTVEPGNAPPVVRTGVTLIGDNVTFAGYLGGQVFVPDGTRAVITAGVSEDGIGPTRVAVVNAATGKQIGNGVILTGTPDGPPLLNADGTRALITTGSGGTGEAVVINTITGAQIGPALALPAGSQTLAFSATGTSVVITASTDSRTVRVAVINTDTGAQTASTLTLPGRAVGPPVFSPDDSHALITTIDGDVTTGSITRVAVIDTSTGAQSGTTLTLSGSALVYPALFNADGTRALITTDDARVAVIDTITGAQIGTTFTLPGSTFSAYRPPMPAAP